MASCLLSGLRGGELLLAGDRLDAGDLAAKYAELGRVGGALGRLQDAQTDDLLAERGRR